MGARFGIESMHGVRDFPYLTLGRTRKFIRPPWYKGGWMEPLPGDFYMLQYFEMILPLVESL